MPNTHFRHIVTRHGEGPLTYRGPDVASETTATSRLDRSYPPGPRLQLERYEYRANTWRPVVTRDFDSTVWARGGK